MAELEKNPQTFMGRVVSSAMDKTITVLISRRVKHARYGKYIQRQTKLHAHDEANTCKVGDKVLIKACRPKAKTKSFELVEVLETAN